MPGEQVVEAFQAAGFSRRLFALLTDSLLIWIPCLFLPPFIFQTAGIPPGPYAFLSFVFAANLYEPLSVWVFGRTLGHRLWNVKIINKNGERISLLSSFLRYLIKSLLGFVSLVLLALKKRSLHDMLSGSYPMVTRNGHLLTMADGENPRTRNTGKGTGSGGVSA